MVRRQRDWPYYLAIAFGPSLLFLTYVWLGSLTFAQAQAPAWPVGIPVPPFGLDEQPGGAITATVLPGQPMPNPIPAGAVIQLAPGTHNVANRTWTSAGSAAAPAFVVAAPGAILTGTSGFKIAGTYLVLDGIEATNFRVVVQGQNIALRRMDVSGHPSTSAGSVVSFGAAARDVVLLDNEFHDNGGSASGAEADFHGIKISTSTPARRIWVVDHTSYGNGGDSVQCGSATGAEPWPGEVYIVRGKFRDEGENGVDVKRCEDVVLVGTEITGMRASSSDPGRGIVLHDGGRRVTVRDAHIHQNQAEGFVSTGHTAFEVSGSTLEDNGTGARAYGSSTGSIHHNVFRRNSPHLNVTAAGVAVHSNTTSDGSPSPSPSPTATPTPVPTPSPSAPPLTCTLTFTVVNGRLVAGPCQ